MPQLKWTPELQAALVADRASGMTFRELSAKYGMKTPQGAHFRLGLIVARQRRKELHRQWEAQDVHRSLEARQPRGCEEP